MYNKNSQSNFEPTISAAAPNSTFSKSNPLVAELFAKPTPTERRKVRWNSFYLLAWLTLALLGLIQPPLKLTYFPHTLNSALEDGKPTHGFYEVERQPKTGELYVWTEDKPYILLDYHTNQPLKLIFKLGNPAVVGGPVTPIQVLLNEKPAGELKIDPANPEFQEIELRLNPAELGIEKGQQLKLRLLAQTFQPAGDQRQLGVLLQSITLDKSAAWQPLSDRLGIIFGFLVAALIFSAALNFLDKGQNSKFKILLAANNLIGLFTGFFLLELLFQVGPLDWGAYFLWICGAIYLSLYFGWQTLSLAVYSRGQADEKALPWQVWNVELLPGQARAVTKQASEALTLNLFIAKISKSWQKLNQQGLVSLWLGWRLGLIFVPLLAFLLFLPNDPTPLRPISPNVWMERLVWAWTRWDGIRYMEIAQSGYDQELISFYPLYPLAMKGTAFLLSGGEQNFAVFAVGGLAVSLVAGLVSVFLLYRLTYYDYYEANSPKPKREMPANRLYYHAGADYVAYSSFSSQALLRLEKRAADLAKKSVVYLLAFPCAFFLAGLFTESLFLALGLGTFYLARKGRWGLALFLAALALLTKNQGVAVVGALAIEYLQQCGWNLRRLKPKNLLYFGLPVLSLVGWLGYNWLTFDNPFQFLKAAQEYWGHTEFRPPWETVWEVTQRFFALKPESSTWLPVGKSAPLYFELPFVLAFLGLGLVAVWACWRGWLRPAYLFFYWFCLLQPLAYPVPENELVSMPRYLLIAFPAYIILAHLGQKSRWLHYAYLTAGLTLGGLFLTRFALWFWVA